MILGIPLSCFMMANLNIEKPVFGILVAYFAIGPLGWAFGIVSVILVFLLLIWLLMNKRSLCEYYCY